MRTTPAPRPRGWTLLSLASLVAIVSVLVLVSLSRLRGFVLRENEEDALRTVRVAAEHLPGVAERLGHGDQDPAPTIRTLVRAAGLERRLPDAAFLGDGGVMQSHGYFFAVRRVPRPAGPARGLVRAAAAPAPDEPLAVVAWPVVPGETGTALFAASAQGPVLGHPNRGGAGGGDGAPPPLPATSPDWSRAGWRVLR